MNAAALVAPGRHCYNPGVNYLAHARHIMDRPYAIAGSALPDWTRHVNKRARIRQAHLPMPPDDDTRPEAEVLRGVWSHVRDDIWFHQAPAFAEGTQHIAMLLREAFAPERVRASFLAHILLEMLLDAALIRRTPDLAERYYAALHSVDARIVAQVAREITPGLDATDAQFSTLLKRFVGAQFLHDYNDDSALAARLSQVAERVGLDPMDERFVGILPACRAVVDQRVEALTRAPHDEES